MAAWLGGGFALAFVLGALAQRTGFVVSRRSGGAPRCPRGRSRLAAPSSEYATRWRTSAFLVALVALPVFLAGSLGRDVWAMTAGLTGGLGGVWLARQFDLDGRSRVVGLLGGAVGLGALCGGFLLDLRLGNSAPCQRAGLYLAVLVGALSLAGSAAVLLDTHRSRSQRRIRRSAGDDIVQGLALLLLLGLGCGFVKSSGAPDAGLSVLIAASGLAAAWGARLTTVRLENASRALPQAGLPAGSGWSSAPSLAAWGGVARPGLGAALVDAPMSVALLDCADWFPPFYADFAAGTEDELAGGERVRSSGPGRHGRRCVARDRWRRQRS
ncbi:hypothetical protein CY652_00300 [Burkholderia sp. WAC0059]|nr:hypothetical protein CY652_00300 [Burkholderia sp. WAC0059]